LVRGRKTRQSYARQQKRISRNKNYKKGRSFEYRVANHFRNLGYYVKRSYASKGVEDLIAIRRAPVDAVGHVCMIRSEVLLIQCKNLEVERKLSKKEIDGLNALAKQTGGTPLAVFNVDHKLKIEEIEQ